MTDVLEKLAACERAENEGRAYPFFPEIWGEARAEIDRLREAIRQADYVFELLAPENHSQTSNAEMASLLSSVSEKLSRMVEKWDRAALEEKE